LINEGFVVKDKEEYVPTSSIPIFIENCKRLGFISPEKDNEDEINAKFIEKYIKTNCNIETIKRYIRNVKNEKKKKQRNLNLR
jgi:hypothetical protein